MDDLINLFDADPPAVFSPPTRLPVVEQTKATSDGSNGDRWVPLIPDNAGSHRLGSASTAQVSKLPFSMQQTNPSTATTLISFASRAAGAEAYTTNTPDQAKAIPLPSSPTSDHDAISSNADADTDTDTASSKTYSTLSADARPFRVSSGMRIVRSQTPLSFFPPGAEDPREAAYDQWSSTDQVRADDMDPSYYRSEYGGSTAFSSVTQERPEFFTPEQSSPITITSPRADSPDTPASPPGRSPLTSPLSLTTMQDRVGATTPSTASLPSPRVAQSDLVEDNVSTDAGISGDPVRVGHIIDSFRSISLSLDSPTDHSPEPESTLSNAPHLHSNLLSASVARSSTPLSYTRNAGGLLTPGHTGESEAPSDPSAKGDEQITVPKYGQKGDTDCGNDTTLVGDKAIVDSHLTFEELDNIQQAWVTLLSSLGSFQGSLEEGLERLRTGLRRAPFRIDSGEALADSRDQDARLRNARQLAYASSLRATRAKLDQSRAKNEEAQVEIRRLNQLLSISEEKVKSALIDLKVKDSERRDLLEQVQVSGKRAKEVAGRLLRLEEDFAVLKQRRDSSKEARFVAVLLEADGRMFDKTGDDPFESGEKLATTVVQKLSELHISCLGGDDAPTMLVHVFLDVGETTRELLQVERIIKPQDLVQHLLGFQNGLEIGSVSDVPGLHGPSSSIKAYMELYSTLPECSMVILGTGWNRPYLDLVHAWHDDGRIDKLYSIRSTHKFEKDPFVHLGPDKLLYVSCLFGTDIKDWRTLLKGTAGKGHSGSHLLPSSSTEGSAKSSSTMIATHRARPRATREISPDSAAVSAQPPWQVHHAPKPGHGGSLLDQLESMRESSRAPSRLSSPESDRTIGPVGIPVEQAYGPPRPPLAIEIDDGGSIGGSPPSSDSDDPSVTLPHSARKYVRRPIPYAEADRDDNVSEISSFTASSGSSAPRARSPTRSRGVTSSIGPRGRVASRQHDGPGVSGTNMTPLGSRRPDRYASTTAAAERVPWSERMGKPDDLIDMGSRGARADTVHGFKWHDGPGAMRARRLTQEYKVPQAKSPLIIRKSELNRSEPLASALS